jgi:predicted DCC family thiol-disulfide oxidoreductase YuxK
MIFDGDCRFCRAWIERWKQTTGDTVEYVPQQDARISAQFPEIPRERLERAVHLVDRDGNVTHSAEAVFEALSIGKRSKLRWAYDYVPGFRSVTEFAYAIVARHRDAAWRMTRLLWGDSTLRPQYRWASWLFLRMLGLIYLAAFASLWTQIDGLIGSNGILPVARWTELVRREIDGYWLRFPSVIWWSASDRTLHGLCGVGVACSILIVANVAPAPALVVAWIAYQSLYVAGQDFLGFQWDILLLEVGSLAIFVAPWSLWPASRRFGCSGLPGWSRPEPVDAASVDVVEPSGSWLSMWLLRWLLFRLMFQSGCVKLLSGDPTWRDLTALQYHYETQPLPTWIGWWAHQLPGWFQTISVLFMFAIELVVPFLIFLPRRPKLLAFGLLIGLQILIALTGNYCFFNWVAMALCLSLVDDDAVVRWIDGILAFWKSPASRRTSDPASCRVDHPKMAQARLSAIGVGHGRHESFSKSILTSFVLAFVIVAGSLRMAEMFLHRPVHGPLRIVTALASISNTVSSYGLFAVMTTTRPEIVIQGSNDGTEWLDYEFKYKPGDVTRAPTFVAPHQPRVDWQMWFAALGSYRRNDWLLNFMIRLLQGSPPVLDLLAHNPFPDGPPRYVRAVKYEYRFSDVTSRRASGAWWTRERVGPYSPTLTREERSRQ